MFEQQGCGLADQIINGLSAWVKTLVDESGALDVAALERRVREEGVEQLAGVLGALFQARVDAADTAGRCDCGRRLHHAGRRGREVMSSLGPVKLTGVYRRCRGCGQSTHAVDAVGGAWLSGPMEELLTLLGVSMASFAKASSVCEQVVGVKVSPQTLCRVTESAGRRLPPTPRQVPACERVTSGGVLTGSCDGTSVNTREDGWRELKAYRFEHGEGKAQVRLADAALEKTGAFFPRVRAGAAALGAGDAGRLFFVADAAAWIDEGLRINLPTATRIIDIYHAYQHIHTAAQGMFEREEKITDWAGLWCEQLRLEGGRAVWDRLRRTRWRYASGSPPRRALDQLLGYLDRHAEHLDYPAYLRHGWPISSGPMESQCKQLGLRLKGCGMRWNRANVTPMARLLCRWHTNHPLTAAA